MKKPLHDRPFTNRDLLRLLIPLIIEQMLAVTVGLADSLMVSSLGEAAVSSVSLVDTVNVLLNSLFASLATGGAIVTGQYLGAKNMEKAQRSAEQLLIFNGAVAIGITVVMYALQRSIVYGLFGSIEPDVAANSLAYFRIVELSIPFLAVYSAGAALFRVMGDSKTSMKISLWMNLINVTGNALLIYVFKWDVSGVAVPTLASRVFAAFAILSLLRNQNLTLHLSKDFRLRMDRKMVGLIVKTGVPNGIEGSMFQLGKILLMSVISSFGTAAIAANAIGNTVMTFQNLPGNAASLASTTVISQCTGLRDYDSSKFYAKKLLKFAHIGLLVSNALVLLALPVILRIYHVSDEAKELARFLVMTYSVVCCLVWPLSFSFPQTLRASGDNRFVMVVSVGSMWAFRLVLGVVLSKNMRMGLVGVWIAMYVDWVVRAICFVLRYRSGKWMTKAIK